MDRRIMMAYLLNGRLPNEYQELPYIESTGTQYLNLGWDLNIGTVGIVYLDLKCSFPRSTDGLSLFGSNDNSNYSCVPYSQTSYGTNTFRHWVGSSTGILDITLNSGVNDIKYSLCGTQEPHNESQIYVNVNGTTTSATYSGSITSSIPLFLFGKNNNGVIDETGSGYRLHYFKITNQITFNGNTITTVVRELIPCYRKSDNVIGMYDLVNGVFYTNAGSGTFIAPFLPSTYQRVEYIESSGTQYIDTGYAITSTIKVKTKVQFTQLGSSTYENVVFSNGGYATNKFLLLTSGTNMYFFGSSANVSSSLVINTDYSIEATKSYVIVNGTQTSVVDQSSNGTLYLMYASNRGCWAKYYSFETYDNNVLVRNLIPCYRKADDVIGLYDLITNQFFTNQGTGTFTKGSDIL